MARCPVTSSQVFCVRSKVAASGDVATHKPGFAIFGIRAPAYAMPLSTHKSHRNQILPREERREACQLSPGLDHTNRQSVQAVVQKRHVHRLPSVDPSPVLRCACFSVKEPSKWPPIITDGPEWQGYDDEAMATFAVETVCSRGSLSGLFEAFF